MPSPEASRKNGLLGGRQKGAKNRKTLEKFAKRELFDKRVAEKWGAIIDREIEDAINDYHARQYVIDQHMGKARDNVNVGGQTKNPIKVVILEEMDKNDVNETVQDTTASD